MSLIDRSRLLLFTGGTVPGAGVSLGDLASVATTGAYADLDGKPTFGSAAARPATDFATASQGTKADSALQPGAPLTAIQGLSKALTALPVYGRDQYGAHYVNAGAGGGATLITESGITRGLRIPPGATGASAYLTLAVDVADLVGQTLQMRMELAAPAGLLGNITLSAVRAQVSSGAGYSELPVTYSHIEQIGGALVATGQMTIPEGATRAGLTLQISSGTTYTDTEVREILAAAVRYVVIGDMAGRAGGDLAAAQVYGVRALGQLDYPEHPTTGYFELHGGAEGIVSGGLRVGLRMPTGQGGAPAFLTRFVPATGIKAGDRVRIIAECESSADFTLRQPFTGVTCQVKTARTGPSVQRTARRRILPSGSGFTAMLDYVAAGDEYMIGLVMQIAAGGNTTADRHFEIKALSYEVSRAGEPDASVTLATLQAESRRRILAEVAADIAAVQQPPVVTQLSVGASGLSIAAAIAASADASRLAPVRWEVKGRITVGNWFIPAHVAVEAAGVGRPLFEYGLPDGSALNPADHQPFWVADTCSLRGLDVRVKNGRYAVHAEANGANPDAVIEIEDCTFTHEGNSLGSWGSQAAWGMGTSSGWEVTSRGNVYTSPQFPFSWHNNLGFDRPSVVRNIGDTMAVQTDFGSPSYTGAAIRIQPIGSGQRDRHEIIGCSLVGDIYYNPDPWKPSTLDYQPAAHTEIEVTGYGNSPAVFRISDFGRALRIEAAAPEASDIVIGGTAVALLMGEVKAYPGVTNIPAYAHGTVDISGSGVGPSRSLFITSLGQRLGDRSAASVSLTATVEGVTKTVTLGADYTGVSNADILAAINAALDGLAVASSYALGNRYRPHFRDEEASLRNAQSYGILMGSLLAYDGAPGKVRLMTSSDDPSIFAGVAWEDIYPGQSGRVKTRGYLATVDIRRADSAAISMGTGLSVSPASPGQAVVGGSQNLLRGLRANAVRIA